MANKIIKTSLALIALTLAILNKNIWYYWCLVSIYWWFNLILQIIDERKNKKQGIMPYF